jgi:hypothetical protein
MNTAAKHYKFINSNTGNVIFYSSLCPTLSPDEIKVELDKIKTQVAVQNDIYKETVYWEEIKDE